MTDAEIMEHAHQLCARNPKALLFLAGQKTITVLACIVGFVLAMASQYVQLTSATALDLVPNFAFSVVLPILYTTPVIWIIFRFLVKNPYEKN